MRHQELVDKEAELEDLKKSMNLDEQRAQSVRGFISYRENMLISHHTNDMSPALQTMLHKFVDANQFSMTTRGLDATNNKTTVNIRDSFALMNEWDAAIQQKIQIKYGNSISKLCYSIADGHNGFAFSKANATMFELTLVGTVGDTSVKLMEFIVKCLFAPGSKDISHAQWNTTWNFLDDAQQQQHYQHSNGGQPERRVVLRDQISFPSVISFEQSANDQEC